jgi:hypothetical protein
MTHPNGMPASSAFDHRLCQFGFRCESNVVVDAGVPAPLPVVGPDLGQIQLPVDQRPTAVGSVGRKHPDPAVLDPPGGAGI